MEASLEEVKRNIRESSQKAELAIDKRMAEVADQTKRLREDEQKLAEERRRLNDAKAELERAKREFEKQDSEVAQLRKDLEFYKSRGGLFGCCMAPGSPPTGGEDKLISSNFADDSRGGQDPYATNLDLAGNSAQLTRLDLAAGLAGSSRLERSRPPGLSIT
eukprot:TRINITY_DN27130_c2_g1_i1.p1 TRINITY_DN27130_c2_g1~~TRINITY_DN27130_c2_g1_i1.p1  ORF type:complete len:162 (-),score=32.60 TRINITY_DN27130_c2_g1_i1:334-819(-)